VLSPSPRESARALLAVLSLFSLLVALGAWSLFRSQRDRLVRLQLDQLRAVAESQERLVSNWRRERIGDVRTALSALAHGARDADPEADDNSRSHTLEHFAALCRGYGYRRAQLFDAAGRLELAVDANGVAEPEPLPGELLRATLADASGALVAAVDGEERGRFVVLGRSDLQEARLRVVALTVDRSAALFPRLEPWPIPGSTGASYLARPAGDGYAEILRTRPGARLRGLTAAVEPAPAIQRGAVAAGAPAVRAMSAEDGRAVYAVALRVADSPWLLVAVVDRDEVGAAVVSAAARIGAGALLLLGAAWAGGLVFWNRARLRAGRAARERAAELRALVDHAPDAILVTDAAGRALEANRAICDFLGVEREALRGSDLRGWLPDELLGATASSDGRHLVIEREIAGAERTPVPWEIGAGRLPDGRIVAFARDLRARRSLLTEQRIAEETLARTREHLLHAQKMEAVGRLAGGIAHDFNNLLGVVLGYAEMLGSNLAPGSPERRAAEEIRLAAERAAELTRQLLAVGRRRSFDPKPIDLAKTLLEAEGLLRRVLPPRHELTIEIAGELPIVEADESMVLQVLLELLLNARDAMEEGGRIELAADAVELDAESAAAAGIAAGRWARIELRDAGHGMPPEVLARAFEPFFTTRGAQGSIGLGLATVYGIVGQLGGSVTLAAGPAGGTTARLLLPAVVARPAVPLAAPGRPSRPLRVLVVEDVAPLGEMIARMLADEFDVTVLETPEEALALASRPEFELDLLLTDLVLPGLDGRELARRLRERLPGLRVVVMSGYSDLLAEATGPGDLAADAILPKPFTGARLREVLQQALAAAPPGGSAGGSSG
jgi:signal transduction histidine kinase/ActR/RegA family two-component response regulator